MPLPPLGDPGQVHRPAQMPLASWEVATTAAATLSTSVQAIDRMLEELHLRPLRLDWEVDEHMAEYQQAADMGSARLSTAGSASLDGLSTSETVIDLRDTGTLGFSTAWLPSGESTGGESTRSRSPGCSCRAGLNSAAAAMASEATAVGAVGCSLTPRTPGPAAGEAAPVNLEQVLQSLLLHQGLLEDREIASESLGEASVDSSGSLPQTGPAVASRRTLRQMRRTGPLGELSEVAQTTLLGGTLYTYGDGNVPLSPSPVDLSASWDTGVATAAAPGLSEHSRASSRGLTTHCRCRCTSCEGSEAALHVGEDASSGARGSNGDGAAHEERLEPAAPMGVRPALAAILQHNLDRIFQPGHRGSTAEAAAVGRAEAWDHSAASTARSVRSLSSGPASPRSARGPAAAREAEAPPAITVRSPARSFGGALGGEELQAGRLRPGIAEVEDSEELEEAVVSIMALESPSSTPSSQQPNLQGGLRVDHELLDETTSVSGFGDTVQSNTLTARLESVQQSARTVPGETLTIQGGLDGELSGMLQRLAFESLALDESIIRSVRRVLQLGTVLTGQRLSDEEIRALPKVVFDDAEQQSCPICLEIYQRGEFLTSLQCGHFFHVDCLARWFQRSTQCPLCRSECAD